MSDGRTTTPSGGAPRPTSERGTGRGNARPAPNYAARRMLVTTVAITAEGDIHIRNNYIHNMDSATCDINNCNAIKAYCIGYDGSVVIENNHLAIKEAKYP